MNSDLKNSDLKNSDLKFFRSIRLLSLPSSAEVPETLKRMLLFICSITLEKGNKRNVTKRNANVNMRIILFVYIFNDLISWV
jgi:hypothetical protein